MVTAYGREDVLTQAEQHGFDSILVKPVTSSMLFDTTADALGVDVEKAETGRATSSLNTDSIRGSRVLLVEDNEINQQVAIGQLEGIELFLDLAENGAEAVRMVRKNDYDLVDTTILKAGQWCSVRPNEFHKFRTLDEHVEALEIYYLEPLTADIVRENVGGAIGEEE